MHSKNLIHRDLKPQNILIHELLNGFKILKIIDFVISKKDTHSDDYDSDEDPVGTMAYMSPELFK